MNKRFLGMIFLSVLLSGAVKGSVHENWISKDGSTCFLGINILGPRDLVCTPPTSEEKVTQDCMKNPSKYGLEKGNKVCNWIGNWSSTYAFKDILGRSMEPNQAPMQYSPAQVALYLQCYHAACKHAGECFDQTPCRISNDLRQCYANTGFSPDLQAIQSALWMSNLLCSQGNYKDAFQGYDGAPGSYPPDCYINQGLTPLRMGALPPDCK